MNRAAAAMLGCLRNQCRPQPRTFRGPNSCGQTSKRVSFRSAQHVRRTHQHRGLTTLATGPQRLQHRMHSDEMDRPHRPARLLCAPTNVKCSMTTSRPPFLLIPLFDTRVHSNGHAAVGGCSRLLRYTACERGYGCVPLGPHLYHDGTQLVETPKVADETKEAKLVHHSTSGATAASISSARKNASC